jgi:hypothetical protein
MAHEMWHMKNDHTSERLTVRSNILSKTSGLALLLFIAGSCALSSGCAKQAPPQRVEEKPVPVVSRGNPDPATPKSAPNIPPPEAAEVKHTIERVFKDAVTIETDRNPYFFVGDFNGDLSQDLAVVVKPARGKLLEINDELAPWIIVDPIPPAMKKTPYPDVHAKLIKRRRAVVDDGDTILAIIHGYESKGWRDPQATQTYVLKNAVGAKMAPQARKQIVWAGNEDKLPRILGDVITQSMGEQHGFLYYNGGMYAWYDPRTYRPEAPGAPGGMGHGKMAKAMQ